MVTTTHGRQIVFGTRIVRSSTHIAIALVWIWIGEATSPSLVFFLSLISLNSNKGGSFTHKSMFSLVFRRSGVPVSRGQRHCQLGSYSPKFNRFHRFKKLWTDGCVWFWNSFLIFSHLKTSCFFQFQSPICILVHTLRKMLKINWRLLWVHHSPWKRHIGPCSRYKNFFLFCYLE